MLTIFAEKLTRATSKLRKRGLGAGESQPNVLAADPHSGVMVTEITPLEGLVLRFGMIASLAYTVVSEIPGAR